MLRTSLVTLLLTLSALASADVPDQVRLSLERYESLLRASRAGGAEVGLGRAEVRVQLGGSSGEPTTVDVELDVRRLGKDAVAELPLLPSDVAIESATLDGNTVALVTRGGVLMLRLPDGTESGRLRLRYLLAAGPGDRPPSSIIPLPRIPGAKLTLSPASDVGEVWPMGTLKREGDTLTGQIPATSAVYVRSAADRADHRVRRVGYSIEVNAKGDGATIEVEAEAVLTAPAAFVRVGPEAFALIEVKEGNAALVTRVRDGWHEAELKGAGRHVVTAVLRAAVDRSQGQPSLPLALDRVPITKVTAAIPGKRTITFEPPVPLEHTTKGDAATAVTTASAHLPPANQVTVRWTETQEAPELEVRTSTDTYQLVTLDEGVVRSKVRVETQILRGKLKELTLEIPEDAVVYKVAGDGIEDWRTFAKSGEEPRRLRIVLGKEREGEFRLDVELESVVSRTEGADLPVPLVRPLRAFRETGVIALFDGDKVGFSTIEATDYAKVGQDALPGELRQLTKTPLSQAFKHIGAPKPLLAKVATAKTREVRFDARTMTLYQVKEGALVANASVQVEVKSGRRDRLVLTFPKGVAVLELTAPSMAKKEEIKLKDGNDTRTGLEVTFAQALEGTIQIDLELEMLLPKTLGSVTLPDVLVEGAEVQEGSFGITAETGIEVRPGHATDLRRIDAKELPNAVKLRSPREILLGYQYAHVPWALALDVKSHETVETVKAVVTQAWLETLLFEDGHMVFRAVMSVKNEDRQFLRLGMPEGAKVWSVSANGAAIKAVADEKGAVAVPLAKGATVLVEVVYEVAGEPVGLFANRALMAPRPDALVTDWQWLVRVPKGFHVHGLDTKLAAQERHLYRAPPTPAPESPFGALLARADETTDLLFTLAVGAPEDAAIEVGLKLLKRPSEGTGAWLWWAGVLLLVFVVFRRAARHTLGVSGGIMLFLGLGSVVAKLLVLGSDDSDTTWLVILLVVSATVGFFVGRRKAAPEGDAKEAP